MKRFIAATALGLMMAACAAEAANGLALYGSYWAPKDMDANYGGGGKLKMLVSSGLSMEIRGAYFKGLKKEESASGGIETENKFTSIPVEAGMVFDFPMEKFYIYAGGGAGYYMFEDGEFSVTDSGTSESYDVEYDNKWGWYAVAGVEMPLSSQMLLFAEVQYRWLKIEADDLEIDGEDVPYSGEEMNMDGYSVNAGLLFPW
ncbi:MAG: porin family protein [Spartobacteria bacterium]|nr:porin family protein [Spartobacteria bacterium]